MQDFKFSEFNREEFIERGHTTIHSSIRGFMDDSIALHVHRISLSLGVSVDIKHWSTWTDEAAVPSHIDRERNFAKALLAACDIAESIEQQGISLMAEYEARHSLSTAAS